MNEPALTTVLRIIGSGSTSRIARLLAPEDADNQLIAEIQQKVAAVLESLAQKKDVEGDPLVLSERHDGELVWRLNTAVSNLSSGEAEQVENTSDSEEELPAWKDSDILEVLEKLGGKASAMKITKNLPEDLDKEGFFKRKREVTNSLQRLEREGLVHQAPKESPQAKAFWCVSKARVLASDEQEIVEFLRHSDTAYCSAIKITKNITSPTISRQEFWEKKKQVNATLSRLSKKGKVTSPLLHNLNSLAGTVVQAPKPFPEAKTYWGLALSTAKQHVGLPNEAAEGSQYGKKRKASSREAQEAQSSMVCSPCFLLHFLTSSFN